MPSLWVNGLIILLMHRITPIFIFYTQRNLNVQQWVDDGYHYQRCPDVAVPSYVLSTEHSPWGNSHLQCHEGGFCAGVACWWLSLGSSVHNSLSTLYGGGV